MLLDKPGDGKDTSKTWRRYMKGETTLTPAALRRVAANAWVRGWISPQQAVSITWTVNELEASARAIRVLRPRIKERKGYREGEPLPLAMQEWPQEIERQRAVMEQEQNLALEWLKRSPLPDAFRRVLERLEEDKPAP